MASGDIKNPPAPTDSKTAKKKKTKAAAALERNGSPAPNAAPDKAGSVTPNETAHDEAGESPHLRELRKRLRNVNKKLSNATKTDPLIAENPGKSLEELVSLKIINADQKAQRLGIPELEEKSQQLTKQIEMLEDIEKEFKVKLAEQEKNLTEQFEKEKAALVAELAKTATMDSSKSLHSSLLLLSQFLRLAAARRAEDAETIEDEGQALEGVLLQVYSGDENAVATMLKLVHGSDEQTISTSSETLHTTFAQVKKLAIAHAQSPLQSDESEDFVPEETDVVEAKEALQTDPTIAHACLTELDEGSSVPLTNGHTHQPSATNGEVPTNAEVADDASNEVGVKQCDAGNDSNEMSMSQEWVDVKLPRDLRETETGLNATPAAPSNTQSWADEQPEPAGEVPSQTNANDGFLPVQQRSRGNRDGNVNRGRGGYRGRGGPFRGDGRGRGRGRGGSVHRGAPRRAAEESQ